MSKKSKLALTVLGFGLAIAILAVVGQYHEGVVAKHNHCEAVAAEGGRHRWGKWEVMFWHDKQIRKCDLCGWSEIEGVP